MAKLRITRATGEVSDHSITPAIEMAFELHFKSGIIRLSVSRKGSQIFIGLLGNAYGELM